jgi:hypothetical protein
VVRDDGVLAALVILTALVGAVVWSVWRHHVMEDLHAIRKMLEQRHVWEQRIAADLDVLASSHTDEVTDDQTRTSSEAFTSDTTHSDDVG